MRLAINTPEDKMALTELTLKSAVDAQLAAAKTRNPALLIDADRDRLFKDQTFFIFDDFFQTIHAFSNRLTHWTWSFASHATVRGIPVAADITAIYTLAKSLAATRFGPIPFSAAFNDKCPWLNEITSNRTNLAIVDSITDGINAVDRASVNKLLPPRALSFTNSDGSVLSLGTVYCITATFISK